jgi:hypothetical protein
MNLGATLLLDCMDTLQYVVAYHTERSLLGTKWYASSTTFYVGTTIIFASDLETLGPQFQTMGATSQYPKSNPPSMAPNTPKRRKVRFVVCRFSYIEPPEYDSTVDQNSLFYTIDGLLEIKEEVKATAKLIRLGLSVREDQGLCSRGLERRTPKGARKLLSNQTRARKAVLEEQERQQKSGIFSPEQIAAAYKQTCNECQAEARTIGIQDSINARDWRKGKSFEVATGKHDSASRCIMEHTIQWSTYTAMAV